MSTLGCNVEAYNIELCAWLTLPMAQYSTRQRQGGEQ